MAGNQIKLQVKVLPNAGINEVVGLSNNLWRIKIAAPPDKGKANKKLIDYLSEILDIGKDNLKILRGHSSHNKLIGIEGITQEELETRLAKMKKLKGS